jgi:hypothetical protein
MAHRRPPFHASLHGLTTPDGRYLVVRDRLWRATNPSLPAAQRKRWTQVLMTARRQLLRRLSSTDLQRRAARRDVQLAKTALGERGPVWWDDGSPDINRRMVGRTPYASWYERAQAWAATIEHLLRERDPSASICPSDVVRKSAPANWRKHLDEVRHVARHLARLDVIVLSQRGRQLSPDAPIRGPIRLRRGPRW